jgi:hypothetical protein
MPLIMGTRSDNSSWSGFFSSSLDEVKLFDEALDANEVVALYNNDVSF